MDVLGRSDVDKLDSSTGQFGQLVSCSGVGGVPLESECTRVSVTKQGVWLSHESE